MDTKSSDDVPPPYDAIHYDGTSPEEPPSESLTSHLQSQVASLPSRIRASQRAHTAQQRMDDTLLMDHIVPAIEEFLMDLGAQASPPPLATLTIVPGGAVPELAVLSGLDETQKRGELGRLFKVNLEDGTKGIQSPSYSTSSQNANLLWWHDEAMARRLATSLQPKKVEKRQQVARTSPVQVAMRRELSPEKQKRGWGLGWGRWRSDRGSGETCEREATGDRSSRTGASEASASFGARGGAQVQDEAQMAVTAQEVAFRVENDLGILESMRGWAILLHAKNSPCIKSCPCLLFRVGEGRWPTDGWLGNGIPACLGRYMRQSTGMLGDQSCDFPPEKSHEMSLLLHIDRFGETLYDSVATSHYPYSPPEASPQRPFVMSYRIAAPDEYLAITGANIKNVRITKAAWVWPLQRCTRFSVQPHDYAMNLQAMTKEKLQFLLPVVFTIGPDVNQRGANAKREKKQQIAHHGDNDEASVVDHIHDEDGGDALTKYAMLLAENSDLKKGQHYLENIVKGVIEGETRVLVSSMTMEEIFTEREEFKRRIFKNIQGELDQFGLKIYNANVKELKDAVGSTYFQSLSQKAHEGATNQARIDVADAQLKGNVGEAERHGHQDQAIAKINAETAVKKTERDVERAKAEANLATEKAKLNRDVDIARIQAQRATESQDEDLKKEVEMKRAAAELERLRATDVVKASILRESKQQAADAKAYEVQAEARANYDKSTRATDASAYKVKVEAEAQAAADYTRTTKSSDAAGYKTRAEADAWSHAAVVNAEANLQKKLKEAEGLAAMADAYGRMSQAFGGPAGLLSYLMIEKGTYVELAKANATAIQNLQPKISVWNTGPEAGGDGVGAAGSTMRNIYQNLPPLMTTIQDQTGITFPEWQFGRMPEALADKENRDYHNRQKNGT
ncbi:hypothetical protein DL771_005806 [Monosporascus sp. 5C6A]|nr:hypothetical protein DL771_005806 [Monosporascus sp. 5C6A]